MPAGSTSTRLSVRVLGPVQVLADGRPVAIGGSARRVLALLSTRPGRVLSVAALVEGLWGTHPPTGWEGAVQSYVSRLRRSLSEFGVEGAVLTRAPGYILDIAPDAVDAEHFSRLSAEGRRALAVGQPLLAADRLRDALALWFGGTAYEDLDDAAFADPERTRLALARLDAVEAYHGARIAAGQMASVEELEALVAAHPHRERLWVHLVTALYRSGRQTDALDAYRRVRSVLKTDLGVAPGPELREIHQAVLRQDPALLADGTKPAQMPPELAVRGPVFVGRANELTALVADLDRAACQGSQLCWIAGPPGSGRTTLVAALAEVAVHRGIPVYYSRSVPPASIGEASRSPAVYIVDDLDEAGVARFAATARHGGERSHLYVGVTGPAGAENALTLGPLPAEAIAAIADSYGVDGAGVTGVAAAVHDAMVALARQRCQDRVMAVSTAEWRPPGSAYTEIVEAVAHLQAAVRHRAAHQTARLGECPYPGLARFDTRDGAFFHGREDVSADLVARLAGSRFLAVVGASGSGKSSVVLAGLVPLIQAGALPGADGWRLVVATAQRMTAEGVMDVVDGATPVLFVVDQFEEIFTALDGPDRAKLIDALLAAVAAGHRVVVTLRADYFGHCASHPGLATLTAANTVLLGPMNAEQLRRAAESPGRATGLAFEPGLVDRMLGESDDAAASLPLLSAALRALWERRSGRRLTTAAYEGSGGVAGAVAELGESAYARLTAAEQAAARRLLVRLAVAGDDGLPVRGRVTRAEWDEIGGAEAGPVLAVLIERRLVTVDANAIQVTHEALFGSWPRLASWLDEDNAGRRLRTRLTPAVRDWIAAHRDASLLWRGGRLAAATEWAADRPERLTEPEREFIAASSAAEESERHRQRRAHRRLRLLLATVASALVLALIGAGIAVIQRNAANLASLQADAHRLSAQALIERDVRKALLLAVAAVRLDNTPDSRGNLLAALLRSPQLVAAGGVNDGDRLLGMTLSPDGSTIVTTSFTGRVRRYDATTLQARGDALRPGPQPAYGSSFRPDGRLLVWGTETTPGGGGMSLVDTATGQSDGLAQAPGGVGFAMPVEDGGLVAMVNDGSVIRWAPSSGQRSELAPPGSAVFMSGSVDHRFAVYIGRSGSVLLNLATGSGEPLPSAAGGAVAVNPDGSVLTTGADRTVLQLWRRTGAGQFRLVASGLRHTAAIQAAAWSADGRQIVSCGDDSLVLRWDARTLKPLDVYAGHAGRVTACAFAPGGRTIYSAGLDGALLAWDTTATRGLETIAAPGERDTHFERGVVMAGGKRVVELSTNSARVFDTTSGTPAAAPYTFGHDVVDVSADPAGDRMGVALEDGSALVWSASTGQPAGPPMRTPDRQSLAVALAPDASLLALATDRQVYLFDPRTGGQVGRPVPLPRGVQCLAISPDHHWLAVGLDEGHVNVLDLTSGRTAAVLEANPPEYPVWEVAFSPDGRLLATGGVHGRPSLWQVDGWTRRWKADTGHNGYDLALSFSEDSTVLASSGTDTRIFLYDTGTGNLIGTALGSRDNLWTYAAYAGRRPELVAVGEDGSIDRWDLDPDSWVRRACAIAGRELTLQEWRDVLPDRGYRAICQSSGPADTGQ